MFQFGVKSALARRRVSRSFEPLEGQAVEIEDQALEIVSGASTSRLSAGPWKPFVDHARNWLKRYLRRAQEPTSQSEHRRE